MRGNAHHALEFPQQMIGTHAGESRKMEQWQGVLGLALDPLCQFLHLAGIYRKGRNGRLCIGKSRCNGRHKMDGEFLDARRVVQHGVRTWQKLGAARLRRQGRMLERQPLSAGDTGQNRFVKSGVKMKG